MRSKIYALVDCNNFYVSCERLFNPRLRDQPVIVLSNNDGCAVARSNEAKALGIPMGAPLFKIKDLVEEHGVQVFSSNYTLYGDLSQRVMETLAQFTPEVEIYSIDEAFLDLSAIPSTKLAEYGREIRAIVQQWTGIPVSIGIAETKTLAKLANRLAKKSEKAQGVLDLTHSPWQEEALRRTAVADLWGIGPRSAEFLIAHGVHTALELRDSDDRWIRQHLKLPGLQVVQELRGICCHALTPAPQTQKSTCVSRSFGQPVTELGDLKEAVATYTSKAAEKLRRLDLVSESVTVFLQTNRFREDLPQYHPSHTLSLPIASNHTPELLHYALGLVTHLYREGYQYKKAGVILSPLLPADQIQMNLFAPSESNQRLMQVMDNLNQIYGPGTLRYGSTGLKRPWQMRSEQRTPRYTTCWAEIPKVD